MRSILLVVLVILGGCASSQPKDVRVEWPFSQPFQSPDGEVGFEIRSVKQSYLFGWASKICNSFTKYGIGSGGYSVLSMNTVTDTYGGGRGNVIEIVPGAYYSSTPSIYSESYFVGVISCKGTDFKKDAEKFYWPKYMDEKIQFLGLSSP